MRCPKCSYISFDHLTACAKCGRDISETAAELQGSSINVEVPMFLSGALAAFTESEESFEEHATEAEVSEGIDFDMEMESEPEEEGIEMAGAEEDVDFSFEEEGAEEADFEVAAEEEESMSLAEAEAEEAAGDEGISEEEEPAVEAAAEEAPEEEMAAAEEDESFDEFDFMTAEDEE